MPTYFLLDPFEFPYYFYRIRGELIKVLSIVVCIPSTFCPTLGHHQGRIYYKSDVTFVLANYYCVRTSLLLEITAFAFKCNSVKTSLHSSNLLKQKLHHFCNRIPWMMAQSRAESTRDTYNYGQYINQFPPNTIKVIREFERIQKKICRHKMSIMFNEICIYIYIYIYIWLKGFIFYY